MLRLRTNGFPAICPIFGVTCLIRVVGTTCRDRSTKSAPIAPEMIDRAERLSVTAGAHVSSPRSSEVMFNFHSKREAAFLMPQRSSCLAFRRGLATVVGDDRQIATRAGTPIVLVHGFRVMSPGEDAKEEWSSLSKIAEVLQARGHAVHKFIYNPKDDTVDRHATALSNFMSDLVFSSSKIHLPDHQDGKQVKLGVVSNSFGGLVTRAAFNCDAWRQCGALSGDQDMARCVLIAPPNKGSSLARALHPERWNNHLEGWDYAKQAFSMFSQTVLGDKAGMELAQVCEKGAEALFGRFPDWADVMVVAGDCGAINPILDGSSDGIVTVEETYLSTPHHRMELSAPHNLLARHPTAVRTVVDFILTGRTAGCVHNMGGGCK